MSTDTSIFGNNQNDGGNPTDNAGTSNSGNANPDAQITDLLNSIKNERGEPKYKTLQDAIVGLKNAQDYIPTLKQTLTEKEREVEELRQKAARTAELEETVRRLTSEGTNNGTPPKNTSPEDIAALVKTAVEATLTDRERVTTQQANTKLVVDSLKAKFGNDAEKLYVQKAQELGVSIEEFNRLAANTPKVVLTALGVTEQTRSPNTSSTPMGGTVNTSGMAPRKESSVGRSQKGVLVGATTQDLIQESLNAREMAEELAGQGLSVYDLTDPKVYRKHFGKV